MGNDVIPDKASRVPKYLTVIGSFLVVFPLGFQIMWGNMAMYVYSHVWHRFGVTSGMDTPWVLSSFIVVWNLSCYVTELMSHVDKRLIAALGITLLNGTFFACYSLVQQPNASIFFIAVGGMMGFSTAMLDLTVSRFIADWSDPRRMGFEIFVAFSGTSLGSCVFNPLMTAYVNPDNVPPTLQVAGFKLFTHSQVVDRVPSMFLVLGGASLACQMVGFLLLREKNIPGTKKSSDTNTNHHNEPEIITISNRDVTFDDNKNSHSSSSRVTVGSTLPGDKDNCETSPMAKDKDDIKDYSNNLKKTERDIDNNYASSSSAPIISDNDGAVSPENKIEQVTLSMLLKSPTFYALWLSYLCMEFTTIHLGNYFKQYGLEWIADDHFLTNLTVWFGVSSACLRMVWGSMVDKIGLKTSLVSVTAVGATFPWCVYFSARLDRWLYLTSVTVLYCARSTMTPSIVIAAAGYLGMAGFSRHLGLLTSGGAVANVMAPPFFSYLLTVHGWSSSFLTIGLLNVVALLSVLLLLPEIMRKRL